MKVRVREIILCLALVQTVSVSAQDFSEGDTVQTPNYVGTVAEVINKGTPAEQVRVESNEEIKTSAIYPSEAVAKVEGSDKELSAREKRLLRARNSEIPFSGISLPASVLKPTISARGTISFQVR